MLTNSSARLYQVGPMSRYYWIRETREPRQTGHLDTSSPWECPFC